MLREAEQRSIAILTEHRDAIDKLVALLVANETVDGSVVYEIAGRSEPASAGGMTVAPDRTSSTDGPARATISRAGVEEH
jgi:hypothetical protein